MYFILGHATAKVVTHWLLTKEALLNLTVVHVGFVVDKVTLGQAFLQPLQFYPANCHSISALCLCSSTIRDLYYRPI
jgi:hypothetical protein